MSTSPILNQPPVVSGHWKTLFIILLIFAFGCFSGALSNSMIDNHRRGDALLRGENHVGDLLEHRLMQDIAMDPQLKQSVRDAFGANSQGRRDLQEQIHPQIQMLDRATVAKIDALLQPEQRDQFHHNIDMLEKYFGHKLFDPGSSSAAPAAQP